MSETIKALSATKTDVDPMTIINQLYCQFRTKKLLVAGERKNGQKFSGELTEMNLKAKTIVVTDSDFDDIVAFEDIKAIEQTNP